MVKAIIFLDKIWRDYGDDLKYILLAGIPGLLLWLWLSRYMDYTYLY